MERTDAIETEPTLITSRVEPTPEALAAEYRRETGAVIRRRLAAAALLYLVVASITAVLEGMYHGSERRAVRLSLLGAEVIICALGIGATRTRRLENWASEISAAVTAMLALLLVRYNLEVGGVAERCAMFQLCLLSGVVVLMPWGCRQQLLVASASTVGFLLSAPHLPASDARAFAAVALVTGAATSTIGAHFLDRSRRSAFEQKALLLAASAVRTEEADVASALLRIGRTLNANLDRPEMLASVNALAAETIGCEWTSTFIWDSAREAFRLSSCAGVRPEVEAELANVEFREDGLPLARVLRAGQRVEIVGSADQSLVPAALLERWDVAAGLFTPIARRGTVIGVLILGQRTRAERFTPRQRRLALGIAHATGVAVENARLIRDLQHASAVKSEFVATMSHELRTPLNVILGYADVLLEGGCGALDEAKGDLVGRIRRNAAELAELVNETLDLGRLEAGRETLLVTPVDLAPLLEELARETEALVAPGVTLQWERTVDVTVETDRTKLKTVLKNLVSNALKFTEAGSVAIGASVHGDLVTIVVQDTGVGIPSEALPVIFQMFRQVDGSSTRRFEGVGLGLYIVRRLTEMLGGTVDVTSIPGEGSRFSVTLPARHGAERRATGT